MLGLHDRIHFLTINVSVGFPSRGPAQQRPYLSLGRKDGTLAEFVEPKSSDPKERIGLKIYLQNGGDAPALTPNVGLLNAIIVGLPAQGLGIHTFQHLLRYRDKDGVQGGMGASIPPQSEQVVFIQDLLSQEQMNSMHKGDTTLFFQGILEYCDEFGRYSCRQFSLSFDGPPINAFSEIPSEMECADMYSYPPRRADQSYLLPCEQPAERRQRQEQEQENIAKLAAQAPIASPTATASPN